MEATGKAYVGPIGPYAHLLMKAAGLQSLAMWVQVLLGVLKASYDYEHNMERIV